MLSLTRKTDYALVALSYLAKRWQQGEGAVSARQIAKCFGLPQPLLMNILKSLAQADLLRSTRGVQGGYELSCSPAEISVMEVVCAIEGPAQLTACSNGLPIVGQGCEIAEDCPIREPIRQLHCRINRLLEQMTLEQMIEEDTEDAASSPEEKQVAHSLAHARAS